MSFAKKNKNHLISVFAVSSHFPFPYVTDWGYKEQSTPETKGTHPPLVLLDLIPTFALFFCLHFLKGGKKTPMITHVFYK